MSLFKLVDVTFSYPRSSRPVLKNIDLEIEQGDILSLLGRNGAGKSTLMSCMVGVAKIDSGEIFLDGSPIAALSRQAIAKFVGFVPQLHTPEFAYSVKDFVVMGCAGSMSLFERPGEEEYALATSALERLGIADISDIPYTQISGGQRQQATIARAIVSNPRIVIFDEPTAHLDFTNQVRALRIMRTLSDEGFTVMFSTHNPDHAFLMGGRTALLDIDGNLESGKTEEILTEGRLKAVYGPEIHIEMIESLGRKACLYPAI